MVAHNKLLEAPPYAVEQTLKKVGRNLRLARLRRQQTIEKELVLGRAPFGMPRAANHRRAWPFTRRCSGHMTC
jgi:hypothetical protein